MLWLYIQNISQHGYCIDHGTIHNCMISAACIAICIRNCVNLACKFWKQVSVHLCNFHTLCLARVWSAKPTAAKTQADYTVANTIQYNIWLENKFMNFIAYCNMITYTNRNLSHTLSHATFCRSVEHKAGSKC